MESIRDMSVDKRRELQREAGLEVQPQLQLVETDTMKAGDDTQKHPPRDDNGRFRGNKEQVAAQAVMEVVRQSMTWRQIVAYELKKAAVWAPILLSTGLGVAWVSKRFFKA